MTSRGGTTDDERRWWTCDTTPEGYPLLIRHPELARCPDERYPIRVAITHVLAHVRDDGLPEPSYNRSLADFDQHLTRLFAPDGTVVLVETFAGKRMYYFYVGSSVDLDAVEAITSARFPTHELQWEAADDADWQFLRHYTADFDLQIEFRAAN